MTKFTNMAQLERGMHGFNGTSQFYYGMFNKNSVYTDGFKFFIEAIGGYWLYDIIQTEIYLKLRKLNKLDTFYLSFNVQDEEADIILKDYKGALLFKRHIDYTDAPTGKIQFICGWDGQRLTTCLISEN